MTSGAAPTICSPPRRCRNHQKGVRPSSLGPAGVCAWCVSGRDPSGRGTGGGSSAVPADDLLVILSSKEVGILERLGNGVKDAVDRQNEV